MMTQFASTNSRPNTIRAISIESSARSSAVTEPMNGLSESAQMRRDHVEMALVDRNVDRLADRAARMVQPRDRVGELHEILEIGERPVAPAALEVAHERRAIGGREHDVIAADLERALGIARVLDEGARRAS